MSAHGDTDSAGDARLDDIGPDNVREGSGSANTRPPAGAPGAPALFVDEPFPPYRFVPGKTPHPFAHTDGWGHGQPRPVPPLLPPERWSENRAYLRGCDFFNRGWWWEAHETWEELWHVVEGHHPRQWQLLKALIQLAACALQRERGIDGGAERLLKSACDGLARVAQDDEERGKARYCGLDLPALVEEARARLAVPTERVEGFYLRPAPSDDPPQPSSAASVPSSGTGGSPDHDR